MAPKNNQENMNINPNIQENTNNNADSKPEESKEDSIPTLQVNTRSSTGNLSRKVSFKSFENVTQSHNRSRTNSRNEIAGTSSDPILNNVANSSNSDEIIDQFNNKTTEIIKAMGELHFSTIDLRNKLTKRANNIHPIITQVPGREANTQVKVDIYPPSTISLEGNMRLPTQGDELEN